MRSPAEGARASEDTHAGQQKDACPSYFSVSAAATSCQRFDRRYEHEADGPRVASGCQSTDGDAVSKPDQIADFRENLSADWHCRQVGGMDVCPSEWIIDDL